MTIPTCRHIKEDGVFCHNPALHGRSYCYAHLKARGRQMRMAREARRQRLRPLNLPPLDDLAAVRIAISQVVEARAIERITERDLGLMLWGLQQAASILKFESCMPAADAASGPAQERVEEYPGFEREFGLPEGFDLSQPPEVAFPPLEESATATADAARAACGPDAEAIEFAAAMVPCGADLVTPEDVELEEIRKTQGDDAWKKRFAEIDARRARQRRKVDEARWLLEATQRNYDALHRDNTTLEYHQKVLAEYEERERAKSAVGAAG